MLHYLRILSDGRTRLLHSLGLRFDRLRDGLSLSPLLHDLPHVINPDELTPSRPNRNSSELEDCLVEIVKWQISHGQPEAKTALRPPLPTALKASNGS